MTATVKAAGLPEGSVVATSKYALLRVMDGIGGVWHSTKSGQRWTDDDVDLMLQDDGVVLRHGYGDEGES